MSPLVSTAERFPIREAWELQLALAERRGAGEIATRCCCSSTRRSTRAGVAPRRGAADGRRLVRSAGDRSLDTDRGGLVTYHGPGQLVAYPIVDLAPLGGDVHAYVRGLERVMIEALAEHGVGAGTIEGLTGVWTAGRRPGRGSRARRGRSARSASTSAAGSPRTGWR